MTTLWWFLVSLPLIIGIYAYVLYPALLWVAARARTGRAPAAHAELPNVSIVIPAYNEEAQIAGAIEALLAQDYPSERTQILILSDASSDRTDEIVRSYAGRGVELLRMPTRSGKTAAENASCEHLRGEIIVNSDASIRLQPSTVRHLIAAMADPEVGVASGRDVSVAHADTANTAEAGYVGYEMWLRSLETRSGGIVGASGSGYAIRKSLHLLPIRDDLSRDFSAALTARRHGFTAVSVDQALCIVPRTTSLRREYKRKVRTISRGIATLIHNRDLLNFRTYGLFAWKLFSHKICRWLVPLSGTVGIVALLPLLPSSQTARILFAGCVAGGLVTLAGFRWPVERAMPRLISTVSFAAAANIAVVHSWWRARRHDRDHIWEPTRR